MGDSIQVELFPDNKKIVDYNKCLTTTGDENQHDFPNIYTSQFMPFDLLKVYNEIFVDVSKSDALMAISEYIAINIEPLGWKAIWKPTSAYSSGSVFLVSVLNVPGPCYTKAEVEVLMFLGQSEKENSTENFSNENNFSTKECELKKEVEIGQELLVDLIDLFVVSNDNEGLTYFQTSYVIEVVRFFFQHLWRPWDDLNANDTEEDFLECCLLPRMNFICDIKNNIVSERFKTRYDEIIFESRLIKSKIDKINQKSDESKNQIENTPNPMNEDEESEFLAETELLEYFKLKFKLEDLEREMKVIENGHLRAMYDAIIPEKFYEIEDTDCSNEGNVPTIHLVSNECFNFGFFENTLKVLRKFLNDESLKYPIKCYDSFTKALKKSKNGDKIYLTPGIYRQPLAWIDCAIEICGLGEGVELWSNRDSGDVFFFIDHHSPQSSIDQQHDDNKNQVRMVNLTIKAEHQINQLIVVKSGSLLLIDCILDCNRLAVKPIWTLSNAKVDQNINCKTINQIPSKEII